MRFTVEAWDPSYGSPLENDQLPGSTAKVDAGVETDKWAPIPSQKLPDPSAVLFVDGVRRIDARVWIEDGNGNATQGICASYAAGVVVCRSGKSEMTTAEVRRSLISITDAPDIQTSFGTYRAARTVAGDSGIGPALSNMVQRKLFDTEVTVAVNARDGSEDLLVVDGPLRNRSNLARTLGYIKTHHAEYLPTELNTVVSALQAGERSPVFLLETNWGRYAWYLRLPCPPSAPWAGVVRIEASSELRLADVISLANLSQSVLPRYASLEYKDSRAPQNLFPIAGLEKALKHRLGDAALAYRSLRMAARS
ncbi:MAG: hypothetical protein LLG14_26395 [Nocardiaceae bacterium]|nr:hypothetical protein [Nocardiaceae bacterium]